MREMLGKMLADIAVKSHRQDTPVGKAAPAVTLTGQRIAATEAGLRDAKSAIGILIRHQRSAERHVQALHTKFDEMTRRARDALIAGFELLAVEAADMAARIESEIAERQAELDRLAEMILRQTGLIERGNCQLVDLRHSSLRPG